MLIAASQGCSADRQRRWRKEGEEDRVRQEERRWDAAGESKGVERRRRERERFVSAAAQLTEGMENRTQCALCVWACVCVRAPFCVYVYCVCVSVLQLERYMHTAECVHDPLNAFAWLFAKKRSHAASWRALFCQWDEGSIDLNTDLIICSNTSAAKTSRRDLMTL